MPTFGWSTATTGFSNTVHNAIQRAVIDTLRAGLVALPKGAVVPGDLGPMRGENFTIIATEYPDLPGSVVTGNLTEGVAPATQQLGVSTNQYNATQFGLVTAVTDRAAFQSPHNLLAIAPEKVARTVADYADTVALTALAAVGTDRTYVNSVLGTTSLLDAVHELRQRNVQPVDGAGFYAILHPYALRGLAGESSLNGYIDVTAHNAAQAASLTKGAVAQYRGVTFLPTTKATGSLSAGRTGPTSTSGSATLTLANHGLNNGVRIQFSAITGGGSNIVINTDYFVVNAASGTFEIAATRGGTSIVQNTANMTATTLKSEVYPVYLIGKDSLSAGDLSTFEYIGVNEPDSANPLNQFATFASKGIFGATVLSFAESTNGSGTNATAIPRIYTMAVMSGQTA